MKTDSYNLIAHDFAHFANVVERMFAPYDYARSGGSASNGDSPPAALTATLPIDVWADEHSFTIQAYLSGVKPEEVEITMEGEELLIRGRFPQSQENVNFARRELFHGPFERRLRMNLPVNVESITAVYENGVLTLNVPKVEEVKPKQIKVVAK
jgi:HSP20 family protein